MSAHRVFLKAKYSFYSAIVFFLWVNPETWNILQRAVGSLLTVQTPQGVPTMGGVFLSTIFFFLTMLGLMLLPVE
jgi:hypothetical protein